MPNTRPRRIPRPTATRPTPGVEARPHVPVQIDDGSPGTTSESVAGDLAVALAIEVIGTFLLVFATVSSIVVTRANEVTGAAIAAGLATGVLVASLGHLSAALFNPAIAVAFAVTARLSPARAGVAVIGQAVGAVLGSGAVALTFPADALTKVGNGTPGIGPGSTDVGAAVVEAIATFLVVTVLYGSWFDERNRSALGPLYVGLATTVGTMATASVSGGALNPARWFGPALYNGTLANAWVWVVGPTLGAVVAGAAYQFGFLRSRTP
jgi:glycerol uptake facilitator-like aquaporin